MRPVLSVAVLGVAVACGSKEVPTEIPKNPLTCVTLSPIVTPPTAAIFLGDSIQLTAKGGVCGGPPSTFVWRSSAPSIVSVVRESGVVHALSPGTVNITAMATADTTVRAAALVTVISRIDILPITITSVSYVSSGKPANLDSLAGVIQVDAGGSPPFTGSRTAELVILRGSSDTVVASSTSPDPVPQNYTQSLRWNTDARDAAGARIFANGTVLFRVRFRESNVVVNSTIQQATLKNP